MSSKTVTKINLRASLGSKQMQKKKKCRNTIKMQKPTASVWNVLNNNLPNVNEFYKIFLPCGKAPKGRHVTFAIFSLVETRQVDGF